MSRSQQGVMYAAAILVLLVSTGCPSTNRSVSATNNSSTTTVPPEVLAATPSAPETLQAKLARLREEEYETAEQFLNLQSQIKETADRILAASEKADEETLGIALDAGVHFLDKLAPDEQAREWERYRAWFAARALTGSDVRMGLLVGRAIESSGNHVLAASVYGALAELFARSADKDAASYATRFEGAVRRVESVGQPFLLTGTKLDGTKFDIAELKGKIVLVDFWATWCGPCVQEVPRLQEAYARYRERGFEIVGVSVDEDRQELEAFVAEKKVPWVILNEQTGENPAQSRYGIYTFPTMLLLDREGRVSTVGVRGERLDALLGDLFPAP